MKEAEVYLIYGLKVHSELPLAAPLVSGHADLDIHLARSRPISSRASGGRLITTVRLPGGRGYSLCKSSKGYLLRYFGACEFEISTDLSEVQAFWDTSAGPEILSVFLAGSLFSLILALRGDPVLHASAVAIDHRVIAFVGGSGQGKSTLAALLCAEMNADLVTDDVLRLDIHSDRIDCLTGSQELRLRGNSLCYLPLLASEAVRDSSDGRKVVRLRGTAGSVPLRAIVCPRLIQSGPSGVEIHPINQKSAFLNLVASSSLSGWASSERPRRYFDYASEVVRRVPAFEAVMPWELPLPRDAADKIRALPGNLRVLPGQSEPRTAPD